MNWVEPSPTPYHDSHPIIFSVGAINSEQTLRQHQGWSVPFPDFRPIRLG
jgi:hypothetical protein